MSTPTKKAARIAGMLYLAMGITSGFGILYIPLAIIVPGDAVATTDNLKNAEFLFSVAMVSNLIGQVCFVFLALQLKHLFQNVNPFHAKVMVTLVTAAVPIAFLNTLNLAMAKLFASDIAYLKVFEESQRQALTLGFLNLFETGILVVEIFWGLWLFPLGMLVYQSKFIPKVLGIFLIIGCVAYLLESFTGLLWPEQKEFMATLLMLPLALGEFSIILWLLIKGIKSTVHGTAISAH